MLIKYNTDFYYDLPMFGTVGGLGIFIKNSLDCIILSGFKIVSSNQLRTENMWLEIKNACQ